MEPQNARIHREGGQMLVLFVLALGVLMGFVAMTVDVGMIFVERRSLQNAADAAALAGSPELPPTGNSATAMAMAREFAEKHGFVDGVDGVTVKVQTPHNGDEKQIEVTITKQEPFLFALALGLNSVEVSAQAVASLSDGAGYSPAIFANGTSSGPGDRCTNPMEVAMSGADLNVTGDIISNGTVKMKGSDVVVQGALTYMCDDLLLDVGVFSDGVTQVVDTFDWPVYFNYSDFACDYTIESTDPWQIKEDTPELWLNDDPSTGVLKSGVYCHVDDIVVSQGARGNVTFVSREGVYFKGGPYDFTPYQHNVLIYAEKLSTYAPCPYPTGQECFSWDDSAVHISSNGFTWEGIIFAPNGMIQFSASGLNSPSGGLYGETVKISSSSGSITGIWDDDAGLGAVRLIE